MRNDQQNPTERMQQTSINQAQNAFEQSFELQRNATKMFLSMLEMQDTAGRQGIEITKSLMRNYLEGVEAIMPEMEQAMEKGMSAAPMPEGMRGGGGQMSGGRTQGGGHMHGGGHRHGGRMETGREMQGGGESPEAGRGRPGRMHESGGRQYEQRQPQQRTGEPISQPAGAPGGSRGGHEGGGGGRPQGTGDRYGQQPRHEGGTEEYGRTGQWVPQGGGQETTRGPQERFHESPGGPRGEETPTRRMQGRGQESMERRESQAQGQQTGGPSESAETSEPRGKTGDADDGGTREGEEIEEE